MNVRIKLRQLCLRGGLALVASLPTVGCGGDPDAPGRLALHPVEGKVVLDAGRPLGAGRVILVSRERGMEFEGRLDANGTFRVSTNLGEGVPEGTYRVRIEPDEAKLPRATNKGSSRKVQLPFPARYSNEDTSDLKATIGPGDNRLDPFRLLKSATSKPADPGPSRTRG
jgi:hypothetical protein